MKRIQILTASILAFAANVNAGELANRVEPAPCSARLELRMTGIAVFSQYSRYLSDRDGAWIKCFAQQIVRPHVGDVVIPIGVKRDHWYRLSQQGSRSPLAFTTAYKGQQMRHSHWILCSHPVPMKNCRTSRSGVRIDAFQRNIIDPTGRVQIVDM
jgi:hypothetical protein